MASIARAALRAFAAVHLRPLGAATTAIFATVGIPGAILFSRAGLDPHDVVRWCREAPARLVLSAIVTALAAPLVARTWRAPGTLWLRAAPVSLPIPIAVMLAMAAVLCAPVAILFQAGGGAKAALAALAIATALVTTSASASRSRCASFALAALVIAIAASATLATALAVPGAIVGASEGFRTLAEAPSGGTKRTFVSTPTIALAQMHVLSLLRGERVVLARSLAATLVAGVGALLSLRNDPLASAAAELPRVLAIEPFFALIAAHGLLAVTLRDGHRLRGWLLAAGLAPLSGRVASTLAALVFVTPLGAVFGAIAGAGRGLSVSASFALVGAAWAFALVIVRASVAPSHPDDRGGAVALSIAVAFATMAVALVVDVYVAIAVVIGASAVGFFRTKARS